MLNNKEILRLKDVAKLLKLSRSTIWRRVQKNSFPQPFTLGGGSSNNAAKGWTATDIYHWIEQQKSSSKILKD